MNSRRRLPPLLRRAWYSLNQVFRQRLAPLGLTPDQFTVLRWLDESDACGLTQQEITNLMASDANTVAALLKRMERERLIKRHRHETDRRARRVRVETAGQEKFTAAAAMARTLQTEVLAELPASQRERFLANLEKVANACRTALNNGR
jgi:DNA-binding MarR family transcriptional regulator